MDDKHSLKLKVVGVSFGDAQKHLKTIYDDVVMEGLKPEVKLVKEDENPYDKNAVAVYLFIINDFKRVGYISKEVNVPVRQLMDKNEYTVTLDRLNWAEGTSNIGVTIKLTISDDSDTIDQQMRETI